MYKEHTKHRVFPFPWNNVYTSKAIKLTTNGKDIVWRQCVILVCQRLVAHGRILNMCCSTHLSTLDGSRVSLFFISNLFSFSWKILKKKKMLLTQGTSSAVLLCILSIANKVKLTKRLLLWIVKLKSLSPRRWEESTAVSYFWQRPKMSVYGS